MSDKFDKNSIFDVEWKVMNDEGIEDEFRFKPLTGKHFVKGFMLISKFSGQDLSEESEALAAFDEDTLSNLIELETVMVSQSYPDMPEEKVDRFVAGNVFRLIPPLTQSIIKVSKVEGRRVQ